VRAAIIDLDGTLLDTVADLAAAANAMRSDLGQEPLPLELLATFIGKGVESLVHRTLAGHIDGRVEQGLWQDGMRSFAVHYQRENGRQATLYPQVREGLAALRALGLRLACVTNKPQVFTDQLLRNTGLDTEFELVLGGDALERKKPDPLPLLHVCQRFGVAPVEVVAIGDSVNDALAARAAGMPVLAVPYGYNEGRDIATLDVDAIVATLLEAAHWVAARQAPAQPAGNRRASAPGIKMAEGTG